MTKATVLIVEDDVELNSAYKFILQSAGYEVITAFNGEDALEQLKTGSIPAIIFLDLKMAGMDGIEFLKQYDTSRHPDTTVILFSNYGDSKEVDEAYALGAERYILKARANPTELIRIVESTLADKSKD